MKEYGQIINIQIILEPLLIMLTLQRRSLLEANLHSVEVELESTRVQMEEESEARLDLERQLIKANGESLAWKSKYDSEAAARAEEVEELR